MKIDVLLKFQLCGLLCVPLSAYAVDERDTRFILEQNLLEQQQEQQQALKQQQQKDRLNSIQIDGESIEVNNNVHDVGQALYLAVMQKHWQAAQYYLNLYHNFHDHDLALKQFAQATLARAAGNMAAAEQYFSAALQLQPKNVMIQLEMARLLTEIKKNQAAIALFKRVQGQLNQLDPTIADNIRHSIAVYLTGLQQRDAWQGSMGLGTRYSDNINSSSEKTIHWTRYVVDKDGNRIPVEEVTGRSPDKIQALGLDYDAALNKRWSVQGQHGFAMKAFVFGRSYANQQHFNETNLTLNAGYSFQNQNQQLLLAPVLEHRRYDNDSLSNAWGLRLEWMQLLAAQQALKWDAEIKQIKHVQLHEQDGLEASLSASYWKTLNQNWSIFAGLDMLDHNTTEQYFTAYRQQGLRLGLSTQLKSGLQATLFSAMRWRQFDKFNAVFNAKRADFEQNYTLILTVPQWSFYGLTPSLSYQYQRNQSNVDWFYSYNKHQLSAKLDYRF